MKIIFAILIVVFAACNNNGQATKPTSTSFGDSLDLTADDSSLVQDVFTNFKYDKTVYEGYLPENLLRYLKDSLSEWKIPDPSEWDNLWFQAYKDVDGLVNFVSGDFNGDKENDYAVLLKDKNNAVSAWVIQSTPHGFKKIKIGDFGVFDRHIQVGIDLVEPGKLKYLDPVTGDMGKQMNLLNSAIQVEYFEKGTETYYWDKGQFKSVTTDDGKN